MRRLGSLLIAPLRSAVGHERMMDWAFGAYWAARAASHKLLPGRRKARPRIAVLSMWDENQAALGALTAPNKEAYCTRHGYTWLPFTSGFVADRPVAWSKLAFIRQSLDAFDWVYWSDVDSVITNPAIRLEDITDDPGDLLITRDSVGVNSGSFLIRRCNWSRRFLTEAWEIPSTPDYQAIYALGSDRMWENRAFLLLFQQTWVRRHAHILPQRTLNSYSREVANVDEGGEHRPGDFVLHLPGLDLAARRRILSAYLTSTPPEGGSGSCWS